MESTSYLGISSTEFDSCDCHLTLARRGDGTEYIFTTFDSSARTEHSPEARQMVLAVLVAVPALGA
jgi:hypothetical protein